MSSVAEREAVAAFLPAADDPEWREVHEARAVLEAMAQIFGGQARLAGPDLAPKRTPVGPPSRSRVGFLTLERDGTIRSFSPEAVEIFDCSTQEAIGKPASVLLAPAGEPALPLAEVLGNDGAPGAIAINGVRRDGTTFPVGFAKTQIEVGGETLVALALWNLSVHEAAEAERRQAEARYRSLIEQIPAVTFMGSLSGDVVELYVSPQIEALLGFSQEVWLSDPFLWFNQLHPEDRERCNREFARGCSTGGPFHAEFRAYTRDGGIVWIRGEARMVRDEHGRPTFIQGIAYDITDSKRAEEAVRAQAEQMKTSLAEKEVLLKEVHHRVKNNLQVISSLLRLQSNSAQDKAALEMFNESRSRIHAMALVHEKLYQSENLSRIDFGDYVASLTRLLRGSYGPGLHTVAVTTEIRDAFLGIDIAVPLGMIINELVANSLKYAFPSGRAGNIHLELGRGSDSQWLLRITDDGAGFPQGLDFRHTQTFGMQLVCALTDQIGGSIEMATGNGTEFRISFRE